MKLTLQLQLLPTTEQAASLLATMQAFNAAASLAARVGFEAKVFSQPSIHYRCYRELRERFDLSSQMAVRAIGKACDCFARDKSVCPVFKPHGAMILDERLFSFKGMEAISILTLAGRQRIGLIFGEYQKERFDRMKGQADLIFRDGKFFLLCTIDLPEPPPIKPREFLGIDLGIVNVATDSTGEFFTGEKIQRNRRRRQTARKQHQRKGTKGAKRKLKRMSGRQARFQRHVNHEISKRLVEKAMALGFGIVLEDLSGIRDRIEATAGRNFRRRFGNWGFAQLRQFVTYKAQLAGVPVVFVDPRNTSRTCSQCGHCEKANRKSQAEFCCLHCGFSCNADLNAACNLARLGRSKPAPKVATAG